MHPLQKNILIENIFFNVLPVSCPGIQLGYWDPPLHLISVCYLVVSSSGSMHINVQGKIVNIFKHDQFTGMECYLKRAPVFFSLQHNTWNCQNMNPNMADNTWRWFPASINIHIMNIGQIIFSQSTEIYGCFGTVQGVKPMVSRGMHLTATKIKIGP